MRPVMIAFLIVEGALGIASVIAAVLFIVARVKLHRARKKLAEAKLLEAFYLRMLRDVPREVEKATKQDQN